MEIFRLFHQYEFRRTFWDLMIRTIQWSIKGTREIMVWHQKSFLLTTLITLDGDISVLRLCPEDLEKNFDYTATKTVSSRRISLEKCFFN